MLSHHYPGKERYRTTARKHPKLVTLMTSPVGSSLKDYGKNILYSLSVSVVNVLIVVHNILLTQNLQHSNDPEMYPLFFNSKLLHSVALSFWF